MERPSLVFDVGPQRVEIKHSLPTLREIYDFLQESGWVVPCCNRSNIRFAQQLAASSFTFEGSYMNYEHFNAASRGDSM